MGSKLEPLRDCRLKQSNSIAQH